jgi:hypothetical protein
MTLCTSSIKLVLGFELKLCWLLRQNEGKVKLVDSSSYLLLSRLSQYQNIVLLLCEGDKKE